MRVTFHTIENFWMFESHVDHNGISREKKCIVNTLAGAFALLIDVPYSDEPGL